MADNEKLISDIVGKVDRAERDIATKRAEWLTYYKLYRVFRDDIMSSGRSAVSIPSAFEWVEVVKSRLYDLFFGKKPFLRTIGREPSDDVNAKAIQVYKQWQYEQAKYSRLGYDILNSVLIFGTGIAKVCWRVKEGPRKVYVPADPMNPTLGNIPIQQMVTFYDNIAFDYIDPFDFNVDPEAATIDEAEWCSHRVRRSESYLREMARQGIYKNVEAMITETRDGSGIENDNEKKIKLSVDGHMSDKNLLMKPYELIEYWEDDRVVTIGNGKWVLREGPNPYDHKKKPFVVGKIISVPQEFWGISLIESGAQAARVIEDLINNGMDNLNFSVNTMIGIDENKVEETNAVSTPGKIWPTKGNPNEAIFPFKLPDVTPNIFTFIQLMMEIAKRGTSVTDYVTGQAMTGKTATEASLLTNEAAKRIGLHIHIFGDSFVGPLAEMTHELNRQFVTTDKFVRVTGMGDAYESVRITPDVFGSNVDFIYEHEDRDINSMVAVQQLTQAMTLAQANPALWPTIPIIFYKIIEKFGLHQNDELTKAVELAKTTAQIMTAMASQGMMGQALGSGGLPNPAKVAGGSESNVNQSMQKKSMPQNGSIMEVGA